MRKTAFTILLVSTLLAAAACSRSDEKTAVATPTPVPELTAEQKAAIQNSAEANKAAELKKKDEAPGPEVDTAVVPVDAAALALEPSDALTKPTPTP